jgi:hypothetical protein
MFLVPISNTELIQKRRTECNNFTAWMGTSLGGGKKKYIFSLAI